MFSGGHICVYLIILFCTVKNAFVVIPKKQHQNNVKEFKTFLNKQIILPLFKWCRRVELWLCCTVLCCSNNIPITIKVCKKNKTVKNNNIYSILWKNVDVLENEPKDVSILNVWGNYIVYIDILCKLILHNLFCFCNQTQNITIKFFLSTNFPITA